MALGETEAELSGEIDTIAAILGKPAQDVTSADVDFVTDLIAQQEDQLIRLRLRLPKNS